MKFSHLQVARVCYAAARQLGGEDSREPLVLDLLCKAEQGWWVQAVLQARMGLVPRQVFRAWRYTLEQGGWRLGDRIDHEHKTHPNLVPWDELDDRTQLTFVLLQMIVNALTLDVTSAWEPFGLVMSPLRGIGV